MATTLYRMLTGPDDAKFCHRVSENLSKGWQLYGAPVLAFDPVQKTMICGQALTKQVDKNYSADMTLGDE